MKNLFDEPIYQDCLERINKLTPGTQPLWGKMNVAQMLAHCSEVQEVANGKELKGTSFFIKLFKSLVRKGVVGPRPYKRNTPTHPQYRMADSKREFETEKERLLKALEAMVSDPEKAVQVEHTLFGTMNREEKGWGMYKHLDHHLGQFGV